MILNPPSLSLKPLPFDNYPIKNILDWGFLVKIDRTAVWVKFSATTHTHSFGFSFYHNTEIGSVLKTEALQENNPDRAEDLGNNITNILTYACLSTALSTAHA